MIKYEFEGKEETLLSKPNEISIKLFDEIVEATNEIEGVEYYLIMFEKLGLSKDLCDKIDYKALSKIISDWKKDMVFSRETTITKTITRDGFDYNAYEEDFFISAKDYSMIEKYIKQNTFNYTPYMMAIIYKRNDLNKIEHYDSSHLKLKAKLFEDMTLEDALPIITEFGKTFNDTLKVIYGEDELQ